MRDEKERETEKKREKIRDGHVKTEVGEDGEKRGR